MRWAPTASDSVTVGSRPSGTRATVTPMANRKPSAAGVPTRQREPKKPAPTPTAMRSDEPDDPVELAGERGRAGGDPPAVSLAMSASRVRPPVAAMTALGPRPRPRSVPATRGSPTATVDRHALAGERGRVDAQADGAEQLADRRRPGRPPPAARRRRRRARRRRPPRSRHRGRPSRGEEQVAQPFGRALGPVLLDEGEDAVDHDDDEDGDGQLRHARRRKRARRRSTAGARRSAPSAPRGAARRGTGCGLGSRLGPSRAAGASSLPRPP